MKKLKKVNIQLLLSWVVTVFVATLFFSCATTIPGRDSIAPKFTFTVDGPGIHERFEDDRFDFDNQVLYLKRGETYKVTFTGSDREGCKAIWWQLQAQPPTIDFPETLHEGWYQTTIPNDSYQIAWNGNPSAPVTGKGLTTKMIANGNTTNNIEEIDMLFVVRDYHDNDVRKILTMRIHNEGPRVGSR